MKKNLLYSLYILALVGLLFLIFSLPVMKGLLDSFEYKSYDFRQKINLRHKSPSSEIVILAIDDNSLELLEDEYGRWPWARNAYADAINSLAKYGAKQVVLDLMFAGHSKDKQSDKALIEAFLSNDIVLAATNLDHRKTSKTIPDSMAVNVEDESSIIFPVFKGFRPILKELMGTTRVGMINCQRDADGISRRVPTLFKHEHEFYPYLGLKAFGRHIGASKYVINKGNELVLKDRKYALDDSGTLILNWYSNKFKIIPFWRMHKAAKEFEGKTVFVGVTVASLYDIKSTPVSRNMSGIELQATMFNNLLDGNFIHRSSPMTTFVVAAVFSILIGLATLYWQATAASVAFCLAVVVAYSAVSIILLQYFNYWIDVVFVLLAVVITFIGSYILKYKNKSKDFEHTYKLATTDGLTNLYNHRFFQEQMAMLLENAKRYETKFSLVLIDIDFFKKFNDAYGHQAGDAVLKQVAALLKSSVRSTDIVARYGGEEMAIILPNTDHESASITAQKICDLIAMTPFYLNANTTKSVTISLGVATFPDKAQSVTDMIEYADKGLYAAKENGRNQVGKVLG